MISERKIDSNGEGLKTILFPMENYSEQKCTRARVFSDAIYILGEGDEILIDTFYME